MYSTNEAIKLHGAEKVTNATIGVVLDEEGKLATLPTVEKVFRAMEFADLVSYAPISGLPAYLDAVIDLTLPKTNLTDFLERLRLLEAPERFITQSQTTLNAATPF